MSVGLGRVLYQHNDDQYFDEMLAEAEKENNKSDVEKSIFLNSDADLTDNFQAENEKNRSHSISAILRYYKESYSNKVDFQRKYRKILFWGCSGIILALCIAVLVTIWCTLKKAGNLKATDAVAIISVLVTCSASVWELIRIVTKYCFPENDEEYIVKIVEAIQHNDLEKYKERNRMTEAREKSRTDH